MSDEVRLTLIWVGAVLLFLIFSILSISWYYTSKNDTIAQMVRGGVSPIEAACGLDADSQYTSNTCAAFIAVLNNK